MFKHIAFRIVAGLVLLAAIAGIAFFAYQAGVTHGATANIQLPVTENGLPFYPYHGMHPFMGFGFFGVLFAFFLLFLAFGAMRRLIWGPRWGWHHRMHEHGPWGEKGEGFVPPMFNEWHKRAHGSPSADEKSEDKKPE